MSLEYRNTAESPPAQARLVIGSRNTPDIGLARLRARGQLLEIEPAGLRFSVPETREFTWAKEPKFQAGTATRRLRQMTVGCRCFTVRVPSLEPRVIST
jgi:LuxR family transcriptional regulator, maltose regulon positive regulatory protein